LGRGDNEVLTPMAAVLCAALGIAAHRVIQERRSVGERQMAFSIGPGKESFVHGGSDAMFPLQLHGATRSVARSPLERAATTTEALCGRLLRLSADVPSGLIGILRQTRRRSTEQGLEHCKETVGSSLNRELLAADNADDRQG
jgi:hypothetical protein